MPRISVIIFRGLALTVLCLGLGGCGGSPTSISSSTSTETQNAQLDHTQEGAAATALNFAQSFLAGDGSTFCAIAEPSFMTRMMVDPSNCQASLTKALALFEQSCNSHAYQDGQPVEQNCDLDYFRGIEANATPQSVEITSSGATLTMSQPSFLFMRWDGTKWTVPDQG